MECVEVKDLLSEYIDAALDAETKAMVEAHMLTCRLCRQECDSIQAVVAELGSLKPVKAPDDFLEQLHERMESWGYLKKLARTLFIPGRIKIPLALASTAAIAVLVFSIVHIQYEENLISGLPKGATDMRMTKDTATPGEEKIPPGEACEPKPALEEMRARQPEERRRIVELALLFKKDGADGQYAQRKTANVEPAPLKSGNKKRSQRLAASGLETKADLFMKEGSFGEMATDERAALRERSVSSLSSLRETFSKVEDLISLAGGRIISVEYLTDTELPKSAYAEVPAKNYNAFYDALKGIAILDTPPPVISKKNREPVQIYFRFIPSR